MNIEWIGDAIIEQMVDNQILSSYSDLYKLSLPHIRMIVKNLPGMGDKKIDNIIAFLEKSKSNELSKVINALGIPQVGEKTAKVIVDHMRKAEGEKLKAEGFGTQDLMAYLGNQEFLAGIHSIGPETIASALDWIHHPSNQKLLQELESYGVSFSNFGAPIARDSERLQYVRFAITWTFQIPREKIIEFLVKQGATYCPNITKNTNILIIWNNPSSKVSKASKEGIETIEGLEQAQAKFDIDFGLQAVGLF